ncbi:MAG: hypothetical protein FWG88_06510 [Oscillospiraceae bacterium]|nr:hypothetical protein [Oscillospiraceae bacterium]
MKEYYDFSAGKKNPHAAKMKTEGYSITIHYSPHDTIDDTKDIIQALVELMSTSEAKELLLYIKENYDLPCSPDIFDTIDES